MVCAMDGRPGRVIKLAISVLVPTALLVFIVLYAQSRLSPDMFTRFLSEVPMLFMMVYLPVAIMIFVFLDRGLDGFLNWLWPDDYSGYPTNAMMTCKKGHTCRVWVQFSGRGWWHDSWGGGYIYHPGGHPAIIPESCPECGARWEVPGKHNHRKNLKHYGSFDGQ